MRWARAEVKLPTKEEIEAKKRPGRKGGREGPGKKWGHTLNVISGGKLVYIFGGYGSERQTNDVYVYNTVLEKWSKPNIKGVLPPPRDSHSSTLIGTRMYIFGGTDGSYGLNDLHFLNIPTNVWYKVDPKTSVVPSPREGHATTCINMKLYLFGGCGKSLDEDTYFNDVHVFDPEQETWTLLQTRGKPPVPRDSHTCSAWGSFLVVFGGEDSSNSYLNDVQLLDTQTLQWTLLKTSGERPAARAGHATVAIGRFLLVFGGFADQRHLFNDLHLLDLVTGKWDRQPMAGLVPTPRFSLAADLLDPATGTALFFGGCDEKLEAMDDMFVLHTDLSFEKSSFIPAGEKVSLKKELKRRSQLGLGGDLSPPAKRLSVAEHTQTPEGQGPPPAALGEAAKSQPHATYEARPVAERLFEARITDVFHFGYCIETKLDNLPLEGMLFCFKPGFERAAHIRMSQRRAEEDQDKYASKEGRKRERRQRRLAEAAEAAKRARLIAMAPGGQPSAGLSHGVPPVPGTGMPGPGIPGGAFSPQLGQLVQLGQALPFPVAPVPVPGSFQLPVPSSTPGSLSQQPVQPAPPVAQAPLPAVASQATSFPGSFPQTVPAPVPGGLPQQPAQPVPQAQLPAPIQAAAVPGSFQQVVPIPTAGSLPQQPAQPVPQASLPASSQGLVVPGSFQQAVPIPTPGSLPPQPAAQAPLPAAASPAMAQAVATPMPGNLPQQPAPPAQPAAQAPLPAAECQAAALPGSSPQAVPLAGAPQQQPEQQPSQPTTGGDVAAVHQPEPASSAPEVHGGEPAPVAPPPQAAANQGPSAPSDVPSGGDSRGGQLGASGAATGARSLLGMQERLAQELQKGEPQNQ